MTRAQYATLLSAYKITDVKTWERVRFESFLIVKPGTNIKKYNAELR